MSHITSRYSRRNDDWRIFFTTFHRDTTAKISKTRPYGFYIYIYTLQKKKKKPVYFGGIIKNIHFPAVVFFGVFLCFLFYSN